MCVAVVAAASVASCDNRAVMVLLCAITVRLKRSDFLFTEKQWHSDSFVSKEDVVKTRFMQLYSVKIQSDFNKYIKSTAVH